MWKFRRIGDYYELLDGTETLYSCKRLDSIMVDTLEDLCARHNKEIDNTASEGYAAGYKRGLADALGKDEIE